jgi:Fe-S oxidoreductase
VLGMDESLFTSVGTRTTYHAPCHLCRGLGVKEAPRELIRKSGYIFRPATEEETCCGFGGTYSANFPSISAEILAKKLEDIRSTGAELLVTECPGCILQLRGGASKRGMDLKVEHLAEAMRRNLKPS